MNEFLRQWLARNRVTVLEIGSDKLRCLRLLDGKKGIVVEKFEQTPLAAEISTPGDILLFAKERFKISAEPALLRIFPENILHRFETSASLIEADLSEFIANQAASLLPAGMNAKNVSIGATRLDRQGATLFTILRKDIVDEWIEGAEKVGFQLAGLFADPAMVIPTWSAFAPNSARQKLISIFSPNQVANFRMDGDVVTSFEPEQTPGENFASQADEGNPPSPDERLLLGEHSIFIKQGCNNGQFEFASGWFGEEKPEEWFQLFALGRHHFSDASSDVVDLRPFDDAVRFKERHAGIRAASFALAAACALFISWFLIIIAGYLISGERQAKQNAMAGYEKKIVLIDSLKKERMALKNEVIAKQSILGKRSSTAKILEAIASAMPQNTWLRKFTNGEKRKDFDDENAVAPLEVELEGLSLSEAQPTKLLAALEALPIVLRSELVLLEFIPPKTVKKKTKRYSSPLYKFRIKIWPRTNGS